MIRSFRDAATARLFADEDVPRFRAMERPARRKLLLLDGAGTLNDLRQPPGNRLEASRATAKGSIRSGSTPNGGFVSCGAMAARSRLKSSTTTKD
jgi:plasmid maintenance system killer protein